MMSKQDREKARIAKREYDKPRLRTIELSADEVLAIGCKTASSPGPEPGGATCAIGTSCAGPGS
jgi:hypothetical protein